jgi:glyoxylate reductase
MPRILVTRHLPSAAIAQLEGAGDVEVFSGPFPIPADELRARIADKDAVVCMLTETIDHALLEAAPRLKIVANVAVGYDNVDIAGARARGVIVTNTPDVLTESVADFTWALILGITRRTAEGDRTIRRGGWKGWAFDFMLGTELRGKQLGLIGFGRIGRAVAARASAFGVRVVCATRRQVDAADVQMLSLDRLLTTSDIVSLHVPLTPDTQHLIDRRAFARMKRSSYLVNTARGAVVDEAALVWALQERLIAGAALDVYESEPHVQRELLTLENVLLAPHLASATSETRTAMATLAAANVAAVLAGKPPLTPVNA